MISKGLWALVLVAFLGTARCYNADLAGAVGGLPIVGAIVQPPQAPPEYVKAIGTPAPAVLPETDYATWFPAEAPTDPYSTTVWKAVLQFVSATGTRAGWAEACKAVSTAAGTDRAANPRLGAIACSGDATVTEMQQFALHLLGAQASVALWIKGRTERQHRCYPGTPGRGPRPLCHRRRFPPGRCRAVGRGLRESDGRRLPRR
ncbi:MAG: hypothetical protein IPN07_00275 [Dehalococcoidia bacterium]|nr:hypothetical protein [Dehalococcoidia bacterium]